jgi:hypothetical protein
LATCWQRRDAGSNSPCRSIFASRAGRVGSPTRFLSARSIHVRRIGARRGCFLCPPSGRPPPDRANRPPNHRENRSPPRSTIFPATSCEPLGRQESRATRPTAACPLIEAATLPGHAGLSKL